MRGRGSKRSGGAGAHPTARTHIQESCPTLTARRFTLRWFAYSGIGGAAAYVVATLVLPVTAGALVRRRLAAGLEHTCATLRQALDIMTGEVDPSTGLLAAASGETAERIGLDSGLYPALAPMYVSVGVAGQTIQVGG